VGVVVRQRANCPAGHSAECRQTPADCSAGHGDQRQCKGTTPAGRGDRIPMKRRSRTTRRRPC